MAMVPFRGPRAAGQVDGDKDLDTAKAEFKAAWEALKARTAPDALAQPTRP